MTTYNPATCSDQDWATRMASFDAKLAHWGIGRTARNEAYQRFAEQLHKAMGYRAEHADELAF